MEDNEALTKLVRRFFLPVEIILLTIAIVGVSMHYQLASGSALLLMMILPLLAVWYQLKSVGPDQQLGFKPRVIYFCCCIPCVAVLFTLLHWPGYTLLLVAGLACMAVGWGIFLWSRQRDKKHVAAHQASTYMMFMRLVVYSVACLLLLLFTEKTA